MAGYHFLEERARKGAPLLLTFHGTGATEHQFAGLAAGLMPGASHIAPRGDVNERGALRYFRRTGEGVYDMSDLAQRTENMAAFVADQKARLKPARTVGLGYSNGANILASVAFHAPHLFGDIVLLHPLIPFRPRKAAFGATRVLIGAGRHDPICPPHLTDALAGYFREDGAEVQQTWHPGGHEVRPEEIDAAQQFLGAVSAG